MKNEIKKRAIEKAKEELEKLKDEGFRVLEELFDFSEEEIRDVVREWLEDAGFELKEREDGDEEWYDKDNEEWTGFLAGEELDLVYQKGFVSDVVCWFFEKQDEKEIKEKENLWVREKAIEITMTREAARVAAKELGVNPDLAEENFLTGGKVSRAMILDVFWGEGGLDQFYNPEIDKSLADGLERFMKGARLRHSLTDYDLIDKKHMSEDEIEELRREKTKEAKECC